MRTINEIIIHCTATPENRPTTVEEVRGWHLRQGYSDIAYHFLIYLDGSIHEGRPLEEVGAHTYGHNASSIGICYVGGLDAQRKPKNTLNPLQEKALIFLIGRMCSKFPAITRISGHNQYAAKACPCFDVTQWCKEHGL